jgi:hypothetical protein
LLERIKCEPLWLRSPEFADELVGRLAFEGLEAAEIVSGDEVGEVPAELVMALVVEALDGGVLDGTVHPLDHAIIRYVICGALFVLLFIFWNGLLVSPSGTRGAGSTKVRAGRRQAVG